MRYIKLFENFQELDRTKIESDLQDIFVELKDNSFDISVGWMGNNLNPTLTITIEPITSITQKVNNLRNFGVSNGTFKTGDIYEQCLMAEDYIKTFWQKCKIMYTAGGTPKMSLTKDWEVPYIQLVAWN
jgi:hypothetical protein